MHGGDDGDGEKMRSPAFLSFLIFYEINFANLPLISAGKEKRKAAGHLASGREAVFL